MAAREVMGTALLLLDTTRVAIMVVIMVEVEEVIQAEAAAVMAPLPIPRLVAGTATTPVAMGLLKVDMAQLPATRHLLQHKQLPLPVSVETGRNSASLTM